MQWVSRGSFLNWVSKYIHTSVLNMLLRYTQKKKNIILSRSKCSCVWRLVVKVTPTIRDQYIRTHTLAGFGLRVCEQDSCSLWTECKVHYLLLLLLLSLLYACECERVCALVCVSVISFSVFPLNRLHAH